MMMRWPITVLVCALVMTAAIVFVSVRPAISQQRGAGFMMASGSAAYAWRINTVTGSVSYCVRRSDSLDPAYIAENPPVCSAWTPPASLQ